MKKDEDEEEEDGEDGGRMKKMVDVGNRGDW